MYGPKQPAGAVTGPDASLLVAYTAGPDRNDFSGEVGVRLGIGPTDVVCTWMGLRCHPGNTGSRTLLLYEWFTNSVVRSVDVDLTGATAGAFVWAAIPPTTLLANGYYALMMACTAGMQAWANSGPATLTSAIVNVYDCYRIGAGPLSTGAVDAMFVGVDLGWDTLGRSSAVWPIALEGGGAGTVGPGRAARAARHPGPDRPDRADGADRADGRARHPGRRRGDGAGGHDGRARATGRPGGHGRDGEPRAGGRHGHGWSARRARAARRRRANRATRAGRGRLDGARPRPGRRGPRARKGRKG